MTAQLLAATWAGGHCLEAPSVSLPLGTIQREDEDGGLASGEPTMEGFPAALAQQARNYRQPPALAT
jgi:hypothetical protein